MNKLTDEQLLQELERRFLDNKRSLQELQSLTRQLTILNKKLEESEALKSHFISNITNEIVNPFAAILGLSRSILDVKTENWQRVMDMVTLIHSEALNLDFQLKNIFAAAKFEAGDLYPEVMNVDVNMLIYSVIDAFRFESEKRKLLVNFEFAAKPDNTKSFYFKTDPEKLRLVVSNLISNAIKFSHEGGKIDLSTYIEFENLVIEVKDYGLGISTENQQIIFDRFSRIDSGINSINRGHGLGLSVNKAVLDLLNGKIIVESQLGEGTLFKVIIPQGELKDRAEGFASDGNEFLFTNDEDGSELF